MNNHIRFALIISLLLISLTMSAAPVIPASPGWLCDCNHLFYWQMAQGARAPAPFGTRPLEPMLIRLLPVPTDAGAIAVTVWSLVLLAGIVYAIVRASGFGAREGILGVVITLGLSDIAPLHLREVYMADPVALAFVALGIYAAMKHRYNLFLLALCFGVLAKETVIMILPVWMAYNRGWKPLVLAAIPALIIILLLRFISPPGTPMLALPGIVWKTRQMYSPPWTDYFPFGILPVLALLSVKGRQILRRWGLFLAVVYAQLFIGSDTSRLLVYGFLPVLIAGLWGVRSLVRYIGFSWVLES